MIKIIAIGNSFSQDAMHYLHQIGQADNVEIKAVNLYIGKCNLEKHWNNILNDAPDYLYELNGKSQEKYVSVKEALTEDSWDYVVLQQASPYSGFYDTYVPYLANIASYVKELVPDAEILLQKTWAYETDCIYKRFFSYDCDQQKMYNMLCDAYDKAAKDLGVRLIPSGDAVQRLRTKVPFRYGEGGMSICRDGFHMNIIYGRYLLSAVWYEFLTGNNITNNTYIPKTDMAPNAVCKREFLNVVKETAHEMFI